MTFHYTAPLWFSAPCRWSWVSTIGSPTRTSSKQRVSWAAVWLHSANVQSTTSPSSARHEPSGSLPRRPASCITSDVSGVNEAVHTRRQTSGTLQIIYLCCHVFYVLLVCSCRIQASGSSFYTVAQGAFFSAIGVGLGPISSKST